MVLEEEESDKKKEKLELAVHVVAAATLPSCDKGGAKPKSSCKCIKEDCNLGCSLQKQPVQVEDSRSCSDVSK